ncbi:MAG: DNA topoisomerase-3, partial [Oceanospirillaceae bacterium]
SQAPQVTQAIEKVDSSLKKGVENANLSLQSKAWNDSKVDAHHAIIPTAKSSGSLSGDEALVYQQIARQYLYQFYPPFRYDERELAVDIAGGKFSAKSKQTTDQGWKVLMSVSKKADISDTSLLSNLKLPNLRKGEQVNCVDARIDDKLTSPPAYFNDATLLAAMTGISRFVQDSELKKVLKDTDGIGTEATRAGIIELLFKRLFLCREGKLIKSTLIGKKLIASLPAMATTPDMTALWESRLSLMAERQFKYQQFMHDLELVINDLSNQVNPAAFTSLSGEGKKPNYKKTGFKKRTAKTATSAAGKTTARKTATRKTPAKKAFKK